MRTYLHLSPLAPLTVSHSLILALAAAPSLAQVGHCDRRRLAQVPRPATQPRAASPTCAPRRLLRHRGRAYEPAARLRRTPSVGRHDTQCVAALWSHAPHGWLAAPCATAEAVRADDMATAHSTSPAYSQPIDSITCACVCVCVARASHRYLEQWIDFVRPMSGMLGTLHPHYRDMSHSAVCVVRKRMQAAARAEAAAPTNATPTAGGGAPAATKRKTPP